ncbi:MAG: cobalamin biosynthesis protein [Nitrospirae bacterium]|nr:cobalamin biosynthesis protein [Nitrospirota bacterium]
MATENKTAISSQRSAVSENKKTSVTTAIFYITNNSLKLAQRIQTLYPDARIIKFTSVGANSRSPLRRYWNESGSLIFIMAAGIVVRTISSLVKDKNTDPAVVVVDEKGRYAVSFLSGHLGGANRIAEELADFLKGNAVITTASDVNNLPSIDMWARKNNLVIENWKLIPKIATKLINKGVLKVYADVGAIHELPLPKEFIQVDNPAHADMLITNKNSKFKLQNSKLYLRPKNLVIGIGCNSRTSADEIENTVKKTLGANNLAFASIHSIATIDKKGNEPGLISFARKYKFKVNTFTPDELNSAFSRQQSAISLSNAAFKATGAYAVAEPAALLAAEADTLLVKKQKRGNVTVAVAEQRKRGSAEARKRERKSLRTSTLTNLPAYGKLFIVGTGPGGIEHITPRAQEAIRESDAIVGYGTYLDLIEGLIKDKEIVSTGMTQEVDRCRKAVELALSGKTVSIISGGDPGIYAMAGLVFELLSAEAMKRGSVKVRKRGSAQEKTYELPRFLASSLSVEVIPGISALNACAARLGSPLMHDFASISLSDRLTPWKLIEKRLESAAMADFVIVLYNPKSKGRPEHINKARDIILKYRNPDTPAGIVKGAMRENEEIVITNLKNMLEHKIDMQTTVIIGNSQTFVWNNLMITPRGYEKKYGV